MFPFSEHSRLLMVESAAKASEKGKWSKKKAVGFIHMHMQYVEVYEHILK